jgi:SAM-dependent methyltransferase
LSENEELNPGENIDVARGELYDSLSAEYDAWFDGAGRLTFDIEVRAFREILPRLPKPWLEVGVGSGRFAQALGSEVGLEPSFNLGGMAMARGISVVRGIGERLPFKAETFGAMFLIVTLCFVSSPLEVFKEAHRILLPGGKLVLGCVLSDTHCGRLYQAKKDRGHRYYKYATFYSLAEVTGLLERAGFSMERVISTLFQKPGEVEFDEPPRDGFSPNAGFTLILAGKQ